MPPLGLSHAEGVDRSPQQLHLNVNAADSACIEEKRLASQVPFITSLMLLLVFNAF